MKRLLTIAAAAFAFCFTAAPSHAAPIFTITNTTGFSLGNPPFTLGFEFVANSAMNVTALGLFDDNLNGLAESHQIGLFNSSGTLLASTTIPAGTAAPLTNQFRYVPIPSVTLAAGATYRIGAVYTSGADPLIFPGTATGFATDPSMTFIGSRFAGGATLTNPTLSGGDGTANAAYFGPNALLAAAPEPTTMAVFGLMAVGAFGIRRRLKTTV